MSRPVFLTVFIEGDLCGFVNLSMEQRIIILTCGM